MSDGNSSTKLCSVCDTEKPLTDFQKLGSVRRVGAERGICQDCLKGYKRATPSPDIYEPTDPIPPEFPYIHRYGGILSGSEEVGDRILKANRTGFRTPRPPDVRSKQESMPFERTPFDPEKARLRAIGSL